MSFEIVANHTIFYILGFSLSWSREPSRMVLIDLFNACPRLVGQKIQGIMLCKIKQIWSPGLTVVGTSANIPLFKLAILRLIEHRKRQEYLGLSRLSLKNAVITPSNLISSGYSSGNLVSSNWFNSLLSSYLGLNWNSLCPLDWTALEKEALNHHCTSCPFRRW